MDASTLTLTSEEHELLRNILTTVLNETRVEVHRANFSRDYRKDLQHREDLLRGLLEKLEKVPQPVA